MEQLQFWHTLLVKKTIELPIYIVHFILRVIRFISHITITHYLWVNLFTWLYFFIIHLAWHHQSILVQKCHTCFWIFFLLDDDDKKMHNYAVGTYTNELFINHRFLCTYQLICQRETLLFFCCVCYNFNLVWKKKTNVSGPFIYRNCSIRYMFFRFILFVKKFNLYCLKINKFSKSFYMYFFILFEFLAKHDFYFYKE